MIKIQKDININNQHSHGQTSDYYKVCRTYHLYHETVNPRVPIITLYDAIYSGNVIDGGESHNMLSIATLSNIQITEMIMIVHNYYENIPTSTKRDPIHQCLHDFTQD